MPAMPHVTHGQHTVAGIQTGASVEYRSYHFEDVTYFTSGFRSNGAICYVVDMNKVMVKKFRER